jgi:SAM-dependent methyltransferase
LTRRIFRPTPADWDMIELPAFAWWGYTLIRPLRLTLERSGLRRNDHAILEPALATPSDLLEPLLDIGHVGPDDLLVDVGCGDGRIVVAAVLSRRCRAIGVELSAAAAAEAAELAVREGVSDRVEIVNADLRNVRIDAVTVAILFVPMVLAGGLVHDLLGRLPRGARIVLHEQGARPPELPTPDASFAVVADEAMTVAHRWVAGSADPARHGATDERGLRDIHRGLGSI